MRPSFAAFLAALATAAIAFFIFFARPTMVISVKPETARISFGGQSAVGEGRFTLFPGNYELRIEEDGYVPLVRNERLGLAQRVDLEINLRPITSPETVSAGEITLIDLFTDRKSVLYLGDGGRVLFARSGDEQRALTPDVLSAPEFFKMSPTQDVAVLKNNNDEWYLYDFKRYDLVKQEQFLFGRDIQALDWVRPDGTKLLYSYEPASGERSLILADRTNKNAERVLNFKEGSITNPTISVSPDGKSAILISRPDNNFKEYNIYLFDLFTKRARQLTTDGSKIDARFTPSGSRILYTRYQQDPAGLTNQLISIMDVDGKNRKDFDLRATLDRVDFLDETHLVVAASEAGGDVLKRVDLVTGEIKNYYHKILPSTHFSKIVLTGDGRSIYATGSTKEEARSGTLYRIELATDEYE